jgi:hypothetical protein
MMRSVDTMKLDTMKLPEAAEVFRKWRDIGGQKGHFCIQYVVHEPNENFWKYGVSITSEMAFTESLLLQKGYFLSSKGGRSYKKYCFRSLNGALQPRKRSLFHF